MREIAQLLTKILCNTVAGLYPAYASYKAIKTRELREVVPWLMYWIVLALFSSVETVADVVVGWMPFYYSLKMLFILWLILPFTRGHIYLYRYFVHPWLKRQEPVIDAALVEAQQRAFVASQRFRVQGLEILKDSLFGDFQHRGVDSIEVAVGNSRQQSDSIDQFLQQRPSEPAAVVMEELPNEQDYFQNSVAAGVDPNAMKVSSKLVMPPRKRSLRSQQAVSSNNEVHGAGSKPTSAAGKKPASRKQQQVEGNVKRTNGKAIGGEDEDMDDMMQDIKVADYLTARPMMK